MRVRELEFASKLANFSADEYLACVCGRTYEGWAFCARSRAR